MFTYVVCWALFSLIQNSLCRQCTDLSVGACQKLLVADPGACQLSYIRDVCKDTCGYCPLSCYHCDEEASPEDCKTSVQCDTTNQLCLSTERYADDYSTYYTSGCAEKELCEHLFGYVGSKREISVELQKRNYHLYGGCCDYDLCNEHDPSNTTIVSNTTRPPRPTDNNLLLATPASNVFNDSCSPHDLDVDACILLQIAQPDICQNKDIAERICGNMCGTCLECYNCLSVPNPESCTTRKTCKLYQKCVTIESLDADFNLGYKMGCMDENVCKRYFSALTSAGRRQLPGLSLRGQCCYTSNCNEHGVQTNSTHASILG